MASTHLIAVPASIPPMAASGDGADNQKTGLQRIRELQLQARALAREEIEVLANDLAAFAQRAGEVTESGESYPAGIRELAPRIAEDLMRHANVIRAILGRTSHS